MSRVLAKEVGRNGFPELVLTCSENQSEQIGANRNKSEQIGVQSGMPVNKQQIGTDQKKTAKSEQIGVTPFW